MIIKAIYKIDDRYVVGDDTNIYRLPFSRNKKYYSLKKLKKQRGCYLLHGVLIEPKDIKYTSIEPYEIINDEGLPF